ncbi:MAG TPA: Amuc_1100 family pilus-like protein [Verrucomicrobiae bacterium]|nr:Amuc_1100 family pilus-like protein [Verrucomicrobiae bacterium]
MAWIKRNLYFLIGSLVALGLMGVGGYLLFTQISAENEVTASIEKAYSDLNDLNKQNPHPGNDKVDNIQAAKDQQTVLRAYIEKGRPFFQRTTPIPDTSTNKVTNADFAKQLRNTVVQLQRTAEQQSVQLPHDYYFTFEAQKKLMIFDPASLDKLAVQLGEIKAMCDILFGARVNSLDNIQRESVSTNDNNPPDYLLQKTVSVPLADLAPYKFTFRCFSAELALVLGNLAASPYGFTVKAINVEPATQGGLAEGMPAGVPSPESQMPVTPGVIPGGYGRRLAPGANQGVPAATVATSHGTTTFLNEKPLRVTLLIEVTRLKPPTK